MSRELLDGWGGATEVAAEVVEPTTPVEAIGALADAPAAGAIARGLGRSYGDAAQRAGGLVISGLGLRRPIAVDPTDATCTAGAGWSLRELIDHLVPQGWFLPVVPGTAHVTLGGAIAADIHGKNHHRAKSLGAHVRSLRLVTPDGTERRLEPAGESADEFWATVGGMGLTGVIVEATLQLLPISGDRLTLHTSRAADLDATMGALDDADADHTYTVAWVDLAGPDRRGRGVVQAADHSSEAHTSRPRRSTPRPTAPSLAPNLVRPMVTNAFNELWWRLSPRKPKRTTSGFGPFFHPLDAVGTWGRVYGRPGFTQWQMVVPFAAAETLRMCAARLSAHAVPPSLVVLKRFGEGTPAPLSFPMPGWTLAVDLPAGDPSTAHLLDALDELVVAAGGRLYLAKDARCRPELIAAMYPRLDEWRATRAALDPHGVMASDLSTRLGL